MLTEKRLQRNRQWLLDERARLKSDLMSIDAAKTELDATQAA